MPLPIAQSLDDEFAVSFNLMFPPAPKAAPKTAMASAIDDDEMF